MCVPVRCRQWVSLTLKASWCFMDSITTMKCNGCVPLIGCPPFLYVLADDNAFIRCLGTLPFTLYVCLSYCGPSWCFFPTCPYRPSTIPLTFIWPSCWQPSTQPIMSFWTSLLGYELLSLKIHACPWQLKATLVFLFCRVSMASCCSSWPTRP